MKYKKLKASEYPPSLLSKSHVCYFCGRSNMLEVHHIYPNAFRNKSSYYGCWTFLCREHHTGASGVHQNAKMMKKLQAECQRAFEEKYPDLEFIKIFGRNYYED